MRRFAVSMSITHSLLKGESVICYDYRRIFKNSAPRLLLLNYFEFMARVRANDKMNHLTVDIQWSFSTLLTIDRPRHPDLKYLLHLQALSPTDSNLRFKEDSVILNAAFHDSIFSNAKTVIRGIMLQVIVWDLVLEYVEEGFAKC